jgi:xylulokinase
MAGTGDNPSTLRGLGLKAAGEIAISLGTSDTLFGLVESIKCNPYAHVLVMDDSKYMFLVCTKNGSLVREKFKRMYCDDSWDKFDEMILATQPAKRCGIYLEYPEISPPIVNAPLSICEGNETDPGALVRSIVEAKIASLRLRANELGIDQCKRVFVTGGGSRSKVILQIIADVFNAEVILPTHSQNACVFGSALRAANKFNTTGTIACTPRPDLVPQYISLCER